MVELRPYNTPPPEVVARLERYALERSLRIIQYTLVWERRWREQRRPVAAEMLRFRRVR